MNSAFPRYGKAGFFQAFVKSGMPVYHIGNATRRATVVLFVLFRFLP
jgi:hypothetical protein